jgi:hypothetical protein
VLLWAWLQLGHYRNNEPTFDALSSTSIPLHYFHEGVCVLPEVSCIEDGLLRYLVTYQVHRLFNVE